MYLYRLLVPFQFPPLVTFPAAGCPFWPRQAAVLSEESQPSARPHSAGEAGSAGVPQTFLAAHMLLLLREDGPGNGDVEPPEDSSVPNSLHYIR